MGILSYVSTLLSNQLLLASKRNQTRWAIALITVYKYCGVNLNKQNDEGMKPLDYTSINDNVAISQALIAAGVDINKQDIGGRTALHWAVISSADIRVVRILVKAGADTGALNYDGDTALDIANVMADGGYPVINGNILYIPGSPYFAIGHVKYLRMNTPDEEGQLPLFMALRRYTNTPEDDQATVFQNEVANLIAPPWHKQGAVIHPHMLKLAFEEESFRQKHIETLLESTHNWVQEPGSDGKKFICQALIKALNQYPGSARISQVIAEKYNALSSEKKEEIKLLHQGAQEYSLVFSKLPAGNDILKYIQEEFLDPYLYFALVIQRPLQQKKQAARRTIQKFFREAVVRGNEQQPIPATSPARRPVSEKSIMMMVGKVAMSAVVMLAAAVAFQSTQDQPENNKHLVF